MSGLQKPCISCGELIASGSRCPGCRLPTASRPKASATRRGYDHRWANLSKRLRKQSPFCQTCGSTTNLTVDHIIPLSESPDLRLEPLNCQVLCRTCNSRRNNRCANDERQAVHTAITARKGRLSRHYAQQHR